MEGPRDLSVRAQGGLRGPRHQMSFSVLILLPSTPIQNLQKTVLTTLRPWCPNWWNWLKFKAWSYQMSFSFLHTRRPVRCSELIHQRKLRESTSQGPCTNLRNWLEMLNENCVLESRALTKLDIWLIFWQKLHPALFWWLVIWSGSNDSMWHTTLAFSTRA